MTNDILGSEYGIEILPSSFTDRFAVVHRLSIPMIEVRRRRGCWKMDRMLMSESCMRDKIRNEWVKWRRHKNYYSDDVRFWERCVKKQL